MNIYESLFDEHREHALEKARDGLNAEEARLVALRASCTKMRRLVREAILPELEQLADASEGKWAAQSVRERFLNGHHDFESAAQVVTAVGVAVLQFQGNPREELFNIHMDFLRSGQQRRSSVLLFSEVTTQSIRKIAEDFLREELGLLQIPERVNGSQMPKVSAG